MTKNKKLINYKFIALGIIVLSTIIFIPTLLSKSFTFQDNFESSLTNNWQSEFCCKDSLNIVKTPHQDIRRGKKSLQVQLRREDPDIEGSKRAEIRLESVPINSEYTYKFSLYLPEIYPPDSSFEILAQWHGYPDFDLGETWRSPPLALMTENGNFVIGRGWDNHPVTVNEERQQEHIVLNKYQTNQWTDWVFHIKWSYDDDGLLEVWQNNKLLLQKKGPTTYNDQVGPYFKIGIYKPDWKYNPQKSNTLWRSVYYDDIEIY